MTAACPFSRLVSPSDRRYPRLFCVSRFKHPRGTLIAILPSSLCFSRWLFYLRAAHCARNCRKSAFRRTAATPMSIRERANRQRSETANRRSKSRNRYFGTWRPVNSRFRPAPPSEYVHYRERNNVRPSAFRGRRNKGEPVRISAARESGGESASCRAIWKIRTTRERVEKGV